MASTSCVKMPFHGELYKILRIFCRQIRFSRWRKRVVVVFVVVVAVAIFVVIVDIVVCTNFLQNQSNRRPDGPKQLPFSIMTYNKKYQFLLPGQHCVQSEMSEQPGQGLQYTD